MRICDERNRDRNEEEDLETEWSCRIEVGVRHDEDPKDREQEKRKQSIFPSTPHRRIRTLNWAFRQHDFVFRTLEIKRARRQSVRECVELP